MLEDIGVRLSKDPAQAMVADVIFVPMTPEKVSRLQRTFHGATLQEGADLNLLRFYLNTGDEFKEAFDHWQKKRQEQDAKLEQPEPEPTPEPEPQPEPEKEDEE